MNKTKAAGFGGLFVYGDLTYGQGVLDPGAAPSYIAVHDDVVCSIGPPPPPYCHGTGALSRVVVPVPPDFGRGTVYP